MKSMIIGGIILIIALIGGTFILSGDAFISDDYINMLTMLAAIAIITITVFVVLKYINQIKNDKASGELLEEEWEGIKEYNNSIPTGWGLAFIGVLVWVIWYWTIGYPTNGFSQIGQWNEEALEYNKKYSAKWENASQDELKAMGESIFLVQCATCHGFDAAGINGKSQDLTKRIAKHQVKHAIVNGSSNFKEEFPAGMPPMLLSDEAQIEEVSAYIAEGFQGEQPASYAVCASCHGADGTGVPYAGPNLLVYDNNLVSAVLNNGKKGAIGEMPSFKGRLNAVQEKALATFLQSIGE